MKGRWRELFFKNNNPLVLELGCGKGEYTVGLARRNPEINYIGIDVKGHRFHKGAKEALQTGLTNVAFLRLRVEFIDAFFAPGEVDEIWITFCDPFPLDYEGRRRISSSWFLEKYRRIAKSDFLLHLKHDNHDLYQRTRKEWEAAGLIIEESSEDIYGPFLDTLSPELADILRIRTFYESMWLEEGRKITYLRAKSISPA